MPKKKVEEPQVEEDDMIEEDMECGCGEDCECDCEDEFDLPMVEDAIVDVSFGEPEDDDEDSARMMAWVSSFPPGEYKKQVADLFMSKGEIYVVMDKMSITIPLMEIFRLLEKGDFFKQDE